MKRITVALGVVLRLVAGWLGWARLDLSKGGFETGLIGIGACVLWGCLHRKSVVADQVGEGRLLKIAAALLGVVLLGGHGNAHADTILVTFSGEVSSVFDPFGGEATKGIVRGTSFVSTFTYDANAAPVFNTGTGMARYPLLTSSLRLGDREVATSLSRRITVSNNRPGTFPGEVEDTISFDGEGDPVVDILGYRINLVDSTHSVLSNVDLPTSFNLKSFSPEDTSLVVHLRPVGYDEWWSLYAEVEGDITSISTVRIPTPSAPEPSTLVLLATAGVGLLGVARRHVGCAREYARPSR